MLPCHVPLDDPYPSVLDRGTRLDRGGRLHKGTRLDRGGRRGRTEQERPPREHRIRRSVSFPFLGPAARAHGPAGIQGQGSHWPAVLLDDVGHLVCQQPQPA
jgi:hypothetical protein